MLLAPVPTNTTPQTLLSCTKLSCSWHKCLRFRGIWHLETKFLGAGNCVYKYSLAHNSISTHWGHIEDRFNATLDGHTQLMLFVATVQLANFSTNCLLTTPKSNQPSPMPCCPVACTFSRSQGQGPASLNTLITTKHNSWLQSWIHMLYKARQLEISIKFADAKLCLQEGISSFTLQAPDLYQNYLTGHFPPYFHYMPQCSRCGD